MTINAVSEAARNFADAVSNVENALEESLSSLVSLIANSVVREKMSRNAQLLHRFPVTS
jgi:flagellar biosynthesis/type III secretory pathway protein FliH